MERADRVRGSAVLHTGLEHPQVWVSGGPLASYPQTLSTTVVEL